MTTSIGNDNDTDRARATRGPIWKHWVKGDFAVVLEYWLIDPSAMTPEYTECMRICRVKEIGRDRGVVLGLDQLHLIANGQSGDANQRYYAKILSDICHHIGWNPEPGTFRRLTNAIIDVALVDMIKMPPYVPEQKVVGEATLTVGSQKITTQVMQ